MIDMTNNIRLVVQGLDVRAKQVRFASALALTMTVGDVQSAMPSLLESALDRPSTWTKRGLYTTKATPDSLVASVGWRPNQAAYMKYQIDGGTRAPKRQALRLPGAVALDEFGNMPRGAIAQLVARAKANKRATGRQAKRYGVSKDLDLFYGDPQDGRPAGLYKRVVNGSKQSLIPIVVFPRRSATYDRRFDYYGSARRVVRDRWEANYRTAWARARATARG